MKANKSKESKAPSLQEMPPSSAKKFRQSPEIQGFYSFVYDNDLQKEAFIILERICKERKEKKKKKNNHT